MQTNERRSIFTRPPNAEANKIFPSWFVSGTFLIAMLLLFVQFFISWSNEESHPLIREVMIILIVLHFVSSRAILSTTPRYFWAFYFKLAGMGVLAALTVYHYFGVDRLNWVNIKLIYQPALWIGIYIIISDCFYQLRHRKQD